MRVAFEADSAAELRAQMEAFLGPKPMLREQFQDMAAKVLAAKEAIAATEPRKPKKARAPEPQKAAEPEPELEPEPSEPQPEEAAAGAAGAEEAPDVTPEAKTTIDLHKLKEQQLSRLRDLFNAGKGPLVRKLLAQYGDGAKVFPEVDAKHFPKIKIELDRELGAS